MWAAFLRRAIMQGIPLLYGSTGEIMTEKSGNLNLGIPGVMYVGGIGGVIGAFLYEQNTTGELPSYGPRSTCYPCGRPRWYVRR